MEKFYSFPVVPRDNESTETKRIDPFTIVVLMLKIIVRGLDSDIWSHKDYISGNLEQHNDPP